MKILHLEDNAQDAELARAALEAEWPDCEISLVDNRKDFEAQLAHPQDVIVSDFSMVNFDGLEALQIARRKAANTPFIFLSGTIGEERALEALRAGASDYLLKDRPQRLVSAVQRAINEAQLYRERTIAAEQLMRVQRLENLGMLAAGIAHDFNNVLAPLMMGMSLFRPRMTSEADSRLLDAMEKSAARGVSLIRQILSFSQGVTGETQLIQPKHVLREILEMTQQTFPKPVRIVGKVEDGLWPIRANPTQLHQVLLNLCVNARDAMPSGGTLSITVGNRHLDAVGAAAVEGIKPGHYLLLEVSDTGTGISPDVLKRIWEPFFTTKEAGRGTGLGLSTTRSIVESHGGKIAVHTQLGRGTTFQVFLPAESGLVGVGKDTPRAVSIPRGRGELIVVADDDANVREVTGAILTAHGYRVLAAADGVEALALIAPRVLELRVVISAVNMANLDGAALAKVVASLNPAVRVLLVTASGQGSEGASQRPAGGTFLEKPYAADTLLSKVHELLQSRASRSPFALAGQPA